MKYLAIAQNYDANTNITYDASDFNDAIKKLKQNIKRGTIYQMIRLVELETMTSKSIHFGSKLNHDD